jgi:hypothetical protein
MFVTQEKNVAGIHGLRFFIRGKPWVIDIDDSLLFSEAYDFEGVRTPLTPYFATASKNNLMWGPLIEKGWAKVKGAYMNADGGVTANALRFMSGAPTPSFEWKSFGENDHDAAFKILEESFKKGYLINVGTEGTNDQEVNSCGVATGHAYSINDAFTINDADGNPVNLVMVRNPWGIDAGYNKEWGSQDKRWTDSIAQQVIDKTGFDPRTSTL